MQGGFRVGIGAVLSWFGDGQGCMVCLGLVQCDLGSLGWFGVGRMPSFGCGWIRLGWLWAGLGVVWVGVRAGVGAWGWLRVRFSLGRA